MNRRPLFPLTLSLILGWGVFFSGSQRGLAQAESITTPAPSAPAQAQPATPPSNTPTPETSDAAKPLSLELVRSGKDGKDRVIRVERSTVGAEHGLFTNCGLQEGDPEDAPTITVFNERDNGLVTIQIDKNRIEVPLAVVTQRSKPDGSSGDGRVEASAGSARFLDDVPEGAKDRLSRCAVEVKPTPTPDTVLVTQGKTHLKGQKLIYDESDGIARIDGPITFNRDNEKDPLKGKSNRIEVNVDEEKTVLVGNVVLESGGGRISKAGRVEYDDTQNVARLYATADQPAESVQGSDVVRLTSGYILYHLDNNDVYMVKEASGNLTGEFQDGEKK